MKQSDPGKYGDLLDSINEGSNLGHDEYPENLASAFNLIVKTSRQITSSSSSGGGRRTNKATTTKSYRRQDIGARRHCANDCPETQSGQQRASSGRRGSNQLMVGV
eukprot:2439465-Ditylum_brightwellii.AAC.1